MNSNIKTAIDGELALLSVSVGDFGYSAGYIPEQNPRGGIRGDCKGWTFRNVSGLSKFTNSVIESELSGFGFAITLTFRSCPPTAAAMHKVRRAFIKRLERRGLLRLLWLVEFQRRCVPHFHMAAYFKNKTDASTGLPLEQYIVAAWFEVAAEYEVKQTAQTCQRIDDVGGWFGYLQKHIDRGIYHYQRQKATLPPEWQENVGCVWNHCGDWKRDLSRLYFSGKQFKMFHQLRDCEQKKRIAHNRDFIADRAGSHFAFIGHRRHFNFGGRRTRYSAFWICRYVSQRLEVVSKKYALIAAQKTSVSLSQISKARRIKKASFSAVKKKAVVASLDGLSSHKKHDAYKKKLAAYSACRGIRGSFTGRAEREEFMSKVQGYQRGLFDAPEVRTLLALERSVSYE